MTCARQLMVGPGLDNVEVIDPTELIRRLISRRSTLRMHRVVEQI
jgi:hypothetical protein